MVAGPWMYCEQGCSCAGTWRSAVPANIFEPKRRSVKYCLSQAERWYCSVSLSANQLRPRPCLLWPTYMLVSKAIMNKNTLTSTFCHKSNRVRFSLTYLLISVATDFWNDSGDRLCGVWISNDGVAVTPSVVLNFWPEAKLSSKQSKAMQNRTQAKAEAYRHRWGRTISKLHLHDIWSVGS